MTIEFSKDPKIANYIACFKGQERSPLVAQAAGILRLPHVLAFTGGMLAMSHLTPHDLQVIYPNTHFTLIHNPGDAKVNHETLQKCKHLLEKAGIPYEEANNADVVILARKAKIPDRDIYFGVNE
jgi:hypothetical protein